jgi:hypothetical protein
MTETKNLSAIFTLWLTMAESSKCACISKKVIEGELYIHSEEEISIDNDNCP